MPMYSFRCTRCGKHFEELLPMKSGAQASCPECGGEATREWMGKQNHVEKAGASACPMADTCPNCCPHLGSRH